MHEPDCLGNSSACITRHDQRAPHRSRYQPGRPGAPLSQGVRTARLAMCSPPGGNNGSRYPNSHEELAVLDGVLPDPCSYVFIQSTDQTSKVFSRSSQKGDSPSRRRGPKHTYISIPFIAGTIPWVPVDGAVDLLLSACPRERSAPAHRHDKLSVKRRPVGVGGIL